MFLRLVKELAEKENVTEELKSTDQMLRSLTPEQIAALESALRTIYADLG